MVASPKKGEKTGAATMEVETEQRPVLVKEDGVDYRALLRENLASLNRACELDDKNLIRRVWRKNTAVRKNLSLLRFQGVLLQTFPKGPLLKGLLGYLDIAMKLESKSPMKKQDVDDELAPIVEVKEEPMMEVESYITLFIVARLVQYEAYKETVALCKDLLARLQEVNRQTLDSFVSKTYSYFAFATEKMKAVDESMLDVLVQGQKTASLRFYDQSQLTAVNLILRYYVNNKQYSQAKLFISVLGDDVNSILNSNVGNNEQVRFLYYTGKVAAIESNYSISDDYIMRAIRKTPSTDSKVGLGFRLTLNKLNIVTKLLMGELPERALFDDKLMRKELEPYFFLVKSVKNGSVTDFQAVRTKYIKKFIQDDLITLIDRLKSSVIKTGLRNINLAYSRISFKDIKDKLELKSEKDAELICAKAIRDNIIENSIIEPESKTLLSTETVDMYSTSLEPKEQFNKRIDFCLGVHNAAMKAHQYPPNSHKPKKQNEEAKAGEDDIEENIDLFEDFLE